MNPNPSSNFEDRFNVARATLLFDRAMTVTIKAGGWLVMLAVFAIFIFIFLQIIPLFNKPQVDRVGHLTAPVEDVAVMGVDEWGELPFFLSRSGDLHFLDLDRDLNTRAYSKEEISGVASIKTGPRGLFKVPSKIPEATWTAFYHDAYLGQIALGSADGEVALLKLDYKAEFPPEGKRIIVPQIETERIQTFAQKDATIEDLAFFDSSNSRVVAAIQRRSEKPEIVIQTFTVRSGLFGAPTKIADKRILPGPSLTDGAPKRVLIGGRGDRLLLTTEDGWLYYFRIAGDEVQLVQKLQPFGNSEQEQIQSINWLLGKQSIILTSSLGRNITLASYLDETAGQILYTQIKEFPALPNGGAASFSLSQRNRGFLLANETTLSLRYSTTADVRWESQTDYSPKKIAISPRWDAIFVYDAAKKFHIYALNDPHPNAGWKAYTGKLWYEGKAEPEYEWQSSSGTSDFEPKLSIVPLFFGSLKGTLYAMLFAMPIAILSAIYVSQYLRPETKQYIKPAMEIMASLPSVVLGFLAALWLAPLLEDRVPSILLMIVAIPVSCALLGTVWGRLPQIIRNRVRPGSEWLVAIPVIVLTGYAAWHLGPFLEVTVFKVYDPDLGANVGNFRAWWTESTGLGFEQRNSLVVGIIMGFAVIPIIFTISEDALTNVPPYLTSASLALGASRWQTTWRVVLPTASPGIFSATIIGFGRAVGETMILLMATGNTPIMEWNIFNGMRTLAANIAVELPEAPQYSTLYRTLFLGAMTLFLFTFILNTIAEITRQHLREKYKTI